MRAVSLSFACLVQVLLWTGVAAAERTPPPTRLPTEPGTPVLIPAGPTAEALAQAAQQKPAATRDAASNPMEAVPGANPPATLDGNFLIGPTYVPAPELTVAPGVPQGRVQQFNMDSVDSKFYPGIARRAFGTVDPNNLKTLVVETHPAPYTRTVTVYIPKQYVSGSAAPFIVTHDGPPMGRPDMSLPHILDNMIAQHRLPVMVAIMIANGGGDAQGSERGLEYDTMSGKFAEFIEAEVLPLVEKNCEVKLTKDPDGRAAMGGSSGGAAALEMAWYHPEWYHRVIAYSGTFVNQQWPFNPETPDGAWDFHEKLIPQSAPKPIRIWLEIGDRDLLNPNIMRDNMHDWVSANNRMATVLAAKGYHYQYVFAVNAGHVDHAAKNQTVPEALEWVWHGYDPKAAGAGDVKPLVMADVLARSRPVDWRPLDPENTLYLDLSNGIAKPLSDGTPGSGRVVIELAPKFAPKHVANVKALARERYFDGLSILRCQDNYVVQWGDPNAEKPDLRRRIQQAQRTLPPEFDRELDPALPFTRLPDGDVYAPEVGFSDGFPAARDPKTGKMWLVHEYGMVGAGRDAAVDSGGGTELYVVIGQAPRQLDRNVTLLGRVVQGMELLSALPRGRAALGFYDQPEQFVPIKTVRVAADLPAAERTSLEVLRTDTPLFQDLVESRRNRREAWFHLPAGRIDLCNVPLPVRTAAAGR